jgi:hypothetical protein
VTDPRVWLVGENNPYGPDPQYALYPLPENSAGGRLCSVILGMRRPDYLRVFTRVNLLSRPRWSAPAAREAAANLHEGLPADARVILLGKKVWDAWFPALKCEPFRPFGRFLALPHPSGLSRAWHDPTAVPRARAAVLELAPWLAPLIGVSSRD